MQDRPTTVDCRAALAMTGNEAFHEPVVIANEVKQSRTSEPMDCRAVFVIANEVKQSRAPKHVDRHGLRPRDDDAGSRFLCGIGPG